MTYDTEYNSYRFSPIDMEYILNALSYAHWNDRGLSEHDKNYIDSLYQSLETPVIPNY